MREKLVHRPTPWPTGLAPLGPFSGAKFSHLGPDPASFFALKSLRRVRGTNASLGGPQRTQGARAQKDEPETIEKGVHN